MAAGKEGWQAMLHEAAAEEARATVLERQLAELARAGGAAIAAH
jgi:hypothetical protein